MRKRLFSILLVLCMVLALLPTATATKDNGLHFQFDYCNEDYESSTYCARITATDSSGKVLWTYTTPKGPLAQLEAIEEMGLYNGLYYIKESEGIVTLDPQTGAVVWKNYDAPAGSINFDFDEAGNLYLCGGLGPDFWWIDPNGRTVAMIEKLNGNYQWPCDLWYDNGRVMVEMEVDSNGGQGTVLTVDLKTIDSVPTYNPNDFEIKNGVLIKYKGKGGHVTIPDGVTSIGNGAFSMCDNLISVIIPHGITTIGVDVFAFCDNLTSVTISDSVSTIVSDTFGICPNLTSINVSKDNDYFTSCDGVLFSKDMTEIKCHPGGQGPSYVIPDSVTTIGECAFAWNGKLTSITIPSSVIAISDNAFLHTAQLTDIYYSGTEAQWKSIEIAEYAFPTGSPILHYNSTGLKSEEKTYLPFYSPTGNKTTELDIDWGWDLFQLPTFQYHHQLAALAMTLSAAVEADTPDRAVEDYNHLGFEHTGAANYGSNFNFITWEEQFYPGVLFAYFSTKAS